MSINDNNTLVNKRLAPVLFANKNVMVNSRIKLSGYEQEDHTDNERDQKVEDVDTA
jgi:hypothetical protein